MKKYSVKVNGSVYEVEVQELSSNAAPVAAPVFTPAPVAPAAAPAAAPAPAPAPAPAAAPSGQVGAIAVKAPMNGVIVKISTQVGATVKAKEPILTFEAMKMEQEMVAPKDGTVASIHVKPGDSIAQDDLLITLN